MESNDTGTSGSGNPVDGLGLPAFALLLAVGLGLIGFGVWTFNDARAFRATADEIAGTYVNQSRKGEDSWILTLQLPDGAGTREHRFELNHDYMRGRSFADPIPVLVSKSDPTDLRLAASGSLSPFIFGAIGIALIGLGGAGALHRLRTRSSLFG